ncbi:MAG: CDP-alcohol phosphatidyltransferase family protein [Actinomyces sp.]|nr:MAG: CDP-alcohol phosphatidyltransferase family protein [Actinomyces sp.]
MSTVDPASAPGRRAGGADPGDDGGDPVTTDRILTVPNLVSLVRLACVPVFVWLLFGVGDRFGAALLLGAVGATDWVDGWFARRFGQVSELGKILDPVADRVVLIVAVVAVLVDGAVPVWLAVATLVREGLVAVAALVLGALGARRIDVTWWGKTATFALLFAFPLLLGGASDVAGHEVLRLLGWVCAVPGLVYSYLSAAEYVPQAREALREGRGARSGARGGADG